MSIQTNVVLLAYIAGIIVVFLLGRALLVPVKLLLKLIYNALVGGVILLAINYFGAMVGFHISLNIATALIVGILGIPGILLLIILKILCII